MQPTVGVVACNATHQQTLVVCVLVGHVSVGTSVSRVAKTCMMARVTAIAVTEPLEGLQAALHRELVVTQQLAPANVWMQQVSLVFCLTFGQEYSALGHRWTANCKLRNAVQLRVLQGLCTWLRFLHCWSTQFGH